MTDVFTSLCAASDEGAVCDVFGNEANGEEKVDAVDVWVVGGDGDFVVSLSFKEGAT